MKVAVVHDWLVTYSGAERVLEGILNCVPEADLFAVMDFVPDRERGFLQGKRARTTFIQRLPFARTKYRSYLPLMPLAIEQLDLSAYDLVISSSYSVAKGVLTGPDQIHISYVHSPMRYAWDLQHQYLKASGLDRGPRSILARWTLHKLRVWDRHSANGVDHFLCNSRYIARRILKTYRRQAKVLYPPVDTDFYTLQEQKEDIYVTASRLVPYKRIDVIAAAFAGLPNKKLVIIGDGPDRRKIELAAGANVTILGRQSRETLRDHLQRAKAFIFAAEEDFGISPLEAQACGTSVIAYGKGGVLETVRGLDQEAPTGIFFREQTAEAIKAAVAQHELHQERLDPKTCRANAERFGKAIFERNMLHAIQSLSKEGVWN
jgi:glycosyltransferase involved in cell wall biosynthesis